jgi:autotransporter-associated beta strand protein
MHSRHLAKSLLLLIGPWIKSPGAEINWDNQGGSTSWSSVTNWSSDVLPTGGDTVYFLEANTIPALISVNTSYPDTGSALNLYFSAGHDVTLRGTTNTEFYVNSITVADANCYTLDISAIGRQAASGTMPMTQAIWNITEGGTLFIKSAFGTKVGASGYFTKIGSGTLRLGEAIVGNLAKQSLQLRALEGTTELGYLYGNSLNGIAEIAEGATVRVNGYNPYTITLPFDSVAYHGGLQGLAGIFDLGGNDFCLRSLSGTATGQVIGGTATDHRKLTIGMGGIINAPMELDGDFAGVITDPEGWKLSLTVNGARPGFTQRLSGMNTYTGGTFVRGGRLELANATATLAAEGALVVNGGTVDIGANSQTVAAVTLNAGAITGTSGVLTAASLLVENESSVVLGVNTMSAGGFVKRGTGTLHIQGSVNFSEGTIIESGTVACEGQSFAGPIQISGNSSLTGGIYTGEIYAQNTGQLSGTITSSGGLFTMGAHLELNNLVIEGSLSAINTQFTGNAISIQGNHTMMDWFGVTGFSGSVNYGRTAHVDWYVSGDPTYGYIDGTTIAERGNFFGAMDVGSLYIGDGATLSVHFNGMNDSAFWMDAHAFKIAGLFTGGSITGIFALEADASSIAGTWEQQVVAGDGLYLMWTPYPVAVPEPSTYGLCVGALALAIGCRRRAAYAEKKDGTRTRSRKG